MKKIIILFVFCLIALPAFPKNNNEFTLECSYITAKTDLHIQLKPMIFLKNGDVYSENKKIGKAYKTENDEIFLMMEKGAMFSLDLTKWLSVYSVLVDNEPMYSFGSCQIMQ